MHYMTLHEGETQVECTLLLGTYDIEPQALPGAVYLEKSDVFCFGMLLLSLVLERNTMGYQKSCHPLLP